MEKKTCTSRTGSKKSVLKNNQNQKETKSVENKDKKHITDSVRRSSSSSQKTVWISLSMALFSVAFSGYSWYENMVNSRLLLTDQSNKNLVLDQRLNHFQEIQSDISQKINQNQVLISQADYSFSKQIKTLQKDMVDKQLFVSETINSLEKDRLTETEQLKKDLSALSNLVIHIRDELEKKTDNWNLREAEQLISIANHRLQLMGDVEVAIKALKIATTYLHNLDNNQAVTQVKQDLLNKIAILEQMPQLDITSVVSSIRELSTSLDRLPLSKNIDTLISKIQLKGENINTEGNETKNLNPNLEISDRITDSFINVGQGFLLDLIDLIQIEKKWDSLTPIISAEIKFMSIEKAKLILESAQIALLTQQNELFQQRMNDARNLIKNKFDSQSEETIQWLKKLTSILNISIQSELPDVFQLLKSIRTVIHSNE